jgi:hypothetical protein
MLRINPYEIQYTNAKLYGSITLFKKSPRSMGRACRSPLFRCVLPRSWPRHSLRGGLHRPRFGRGACGRSGIRNTVHECKIIRQHNPVLKVAAVDGTSLPIPPFSGAYCTRSWPRRSLRGWTSPDHRFGRGACGSVRQMRRLHANSCRGPDRWTPKHVRAGGVGGGGGGGEKLNNAIGATPRAPWPT